MEKKVIGRDKVYGKDMEGTDRLACVIWLRACVSTGDPKKKKRRNVNYDCIGY